MQGCEEITRQHGIMNLEFLTGRQFNLTAAQLDQNIYSISGERNIFVFEASRGKHIQLKKSREIEVSNGESQCTFLDYQILDLLQIDR